MPDLELATALQALPLETPERSAWPALQARLPARRRPRWPYALAASVALAAVLAWPRLMPTSADPVRRTASVAAVVDPELALMRQSADLERLLAAFRDPSVSSASSAALALELDESLGRIDAALANPATDPGRRRTLWQERIDLLRSYVDLESTRRYLASQGDPLDAQLVAVY